MNKILDKIEKLLALAGSSNPNEASVALAKAQQLMEEHNLTAGMLERNKIGEVQIKSTQSVSRVKDWENQLVWTVAQAFGCRVMWQSGDSYLRDPYGRFILVGPKTQLQLAEYAATYLLRQVVDGRRRFNTTLGGFQLSRPAKTQQLDGYCWGYVKGVRSKVKKFANPEQVEAAIDAHIKEQTAGRDPVETQQRKVGGMGLAQGLIDGNDEQLHRPMSGGAEVLKIEGK